LSKSVSLAPPQLVAGHATRGIAKRIARSEEFPTLILKGIVTGKRKPGQFGRETPVE
jgi:hypothetical protein